MSALRFIVLGLVSAVVLAVQVIFLRALAVTGHYHFAYLIISIALLGFGASGTVLSLLEGVLRNRFEELAFGALAAFTVTTALSYGALQSVSPDMFYLLYSGEEVFKLALQILLVALPFFFAGFFVGLVLSVHVRDAARLYAWNQLGSGAGGVLGVLLLFLMPAPDLPERLSLLGFLATAGWLLGAPKQGSGPARPDGAAGVSGQPGSAGSAPVGAGPPAASARAAILALAAAACVFSVIRPAVSPVSYDQYKDIARFERLEQQGSAAHVAQAWGPRGQIDIFEAPSLHGTLFASPTGTPPPEQLALLMDGNQRGTLFDIERAEDAAVLDSVPQSLPYRLIDRPRVLLLGEVGAVNVWLAKRFNAAEITVVQRNPQLLDLLQSRLAERGGGVLNRPDVNVVDADPRLFLERSTARWDIIHFVGAEGLPAGSGGLGSLNQDYLLTAEGVGHALARLSPSGLISMTRGVHIPPRDNVRLLATARAGLAEAGVKEPARHLVQARNYLAMTTLISRRALPSAENMQELPGSIRTAAETLLLDIEHYPGLKWGTREQRNVIPGPADQPYSYFHVAARQILGEQEQRVSFFRDWVYDVSPARDNSPYFHGYFKWSSIPRYVESYGTDWLRRIDLGYVVVVITFAVVTVLAFLLVLLPVLLRRRRAPEGPGEGRSRWLTGHTILHFAAIGLGFIFIEIVLIQKLTLFMGDPVYSTAAVLTAILVFAGVGSAASERGLGRTPGSDPSSAVNRRLLLGGVMIVLIGVGYLFGLDPALSRFVGLPVAGRFVVTLLLMVPLTVLLGIFFPLGVAVLRQREPGLVPLAWGVNGFASVSGAPLALLLSMAFGFRVVLLVALLLYGGVAALARVRGVKRSR
jgi:hypothetical protein